MSSPSLASCVLGPIFLRFCYELRLHQETYQGRHAKALFATRGGTRLKFLYEAYLAGQEIAAPCPQVDFYASRMAVAGGCLIDDYASVAAIILGEFPDASLRDVVEALLPDERIARLNERGSLEKLAEICAGEGSLSKIVDEKHRDADVLFDYFKQQSMHLDAYIDELLTADQIENVLLVDTGWSGSTQLMLMRRYPNFNWQGHYFGCYNYGKPAPEHFANIVGLVCEGGPSWRRPESAIFMHRHLVEGPCEARAPSVSGYRRGESGKIEPIGGAFDDNVVEPDGDETVFAEILDYVRSQPKGLLPGKIISDANRAGRRLWRTILVPSPGDVDDLLIAPRSADFGRSVSAPVVHPACRNGRLPERLGNIRTALWRQGQIAREFPRLRLILQIAYIILTRRTVKRLRGLPRRLAKFSL